MNVLIFCRGLRTLKGAGSKRQYGPAREKMLCATLGAAGDPATKPCARYTSHLQFRPNLGTVGLPLRDVV